MWTWLLWISVSYIEKPSGGGLELLSKMPSCVQTRAYCLSPNDFQCSYNYCHWMAAAGFLKRLSRHQHHCFQVSLIIQFYNKWCIPDAVQKPLCNSMQKCLIVEKSFPFIFFQPPTIHFAEKQWSTSSKRCLCSARLLWMARGRPGGPEWPQPRWCRTTSGPPCAWLSAWWGRAPCTAPLTGGTWTRCWATSARGRWKVELNEGRPDSEQLSSVSAFLREANALASEWSTRSAEKQATPETRAMVGRPPSRRRSDSCAHTRLWFKHFSVRLYLEDAVQPSWYCVFSTCMMLTVLTFLGGQTWKTCPFVIKNELSTQVS